MDRVDFLDTLRVKMTYPGGFNYRYEIYSMTDHVRLAVGSPGAIWQVSLASFGDTTVRSWRSSSISGASPTGHRQSYKYVNTVAF